MQGLHPRKLHDGKRMRDSHKEYHNERGKNKETDKTVERETAKAVERETAKAVRREAARAAEKRGHKGKENREAAAAAEEEEKDLTPETIAEMIEVSFIQACASLAWGKVLLCGVHNR